MVYDIDGNVISNDIVGTDIISLNPDFTNRWTQAMRPKRGQDPNGYTKVTQPLALLWFTDIHGDQTALERLVEFRDHYSDKIADTICTGDMVHVRYSDGMTFWNNVIGTDNILTCIGNHDAWNPNGSTLATQQDQYSQYFAPYVSKWGAVNIENGKTYYYKDYADKKIRLVAINCMLSGADSTAQQTWFSDVLDSAKESGLSVVVMSHYPINGIKVGCNFSNIDNDINIVSSLPAYYQTEVQSFVDGGGEFICYLVGHWHCDVFSKGTPNNSQYTIIMDAATPDYANEWGNDNVRVIGTKSQDLANLIVFDTASKVVKVIRIGADMDHYLRTRNCFSFNYLTGETLSDW